MFHKFFVQEKIEAMIIKLPQWTLKVEQDSFDIFQILQDKRSNQLLSIQPQMI